MSSNKKNIKSKNKVSIGKSILKFMATFLVVATVMISAVLFYVYKNLDNSIQAGETVSKEVQNLRDDIKNPYGDITGITNILLIGDDRRTQEESARADTIFIATIDKEHNRLKLTGINRDSYVTNLPNGEKNRKITEVMASDGISGLIYAIEYNFGITLDGYVKIDFSGLRNIVDELGGIEVDIDDSPAVLAELNRFIDSDRVYDSPYIEEGGVQTINGQQALAYSRIRKMDTTQNRILRQNQVIEAIIAKLKETSPTNYTKMLPIISENVETDIPTQKLLSLGIAGVGITPFEIIKSQVPYEELSWGGQRSSNDQWNLFFDVEQTKKFFSQYIYEDIEFDANNINTTSFQNKLDSYMSYDY